MSDWQFDSVADVFVREPGELGLPDGTGEIQPVGLLEIQAAAPYRFWALLRAGQRHVALGGPLATSWRKILEAWAPAADAVTPTADELRLDPGDEAAHERARLENAYLRMFGKSPAESMTTRAIRRELREVEEAPA